MDELREVIRLMWHITARDVQTIEKLKREIEEKDEIISSLEKENRLIEDLAKTVEKERARSGERKKIIVKLRKAIEEHRDIEAHEQLEATRKVLLDERRRREELQRQMNASAAAYENDVNSLSEDLRVTRREKRLLQSGHEMAEADLARTKLKLARWKLKLEGERRHSLRCKSELNDLAHELEIANTELEKRTRTVPVTIEFDMDRLKAHVERFFYEHIKITFVREERLKDEIRALGRALIAEQTAREDEGAKADRRIEWINRSRAMWLGIAKHHVSKVRSSRERSKALHEKLCNTQIELKERAEHLDLAVQAIATGAKAATGVLEALYDTDHVRGAE